MSNGLNIRLIIIILSISPVKSVCNVMPVPWIVIYNLISFIIVSDSTYEMSIMHGSEPSMPYASSKPGPKMFCTVKAIPRSLSEELNNKCLYT
jgi:hypothetical protein